MNEDHFSLAYSDFSDKPDGKTAFELLKCCKNLIIGQAVNWKARELSFSDKVREIMSEMLLILLEDFRAERTGHPKAILNYLKLKIRRLTRPEQRREFAFGAAADLPERGRCNFSACRLDLVEEIFTTVRHCLLHQFDHQLGLLEFLFIHIYPEINWASRLIATQKGDDPEKRLFSDKKRHASFNQLLRKELSVLKSGDMNEISQWSGGERSHLAWRIINISPGEISKELSESLTHLEDWRENIDRRKPQPVSNLSIAERIYTSMRSMRNRSIKTSLAAEDIEPYGESEDILLNLIGCRSESTVICETDDEWQLSSIKGNAEYEKLFNEIARDVCSWFGSVATDMSMRPTDKKEQSVLEY